MYKVAFRMMIYNSKPYIRKAIDSLLKQTEENWTALLFDHGCTDGTGEIIKEYVAKDNRFLYCRILKNGRATEEERKISLEKFKQLFAPDFSEYFAVLDSDDYYHPDFIKKAYKAAKDKNADMTFVGTRLFRNDDPGAASNRIPPIINSNTIKDSNTFISLYGNMRPIWAILYKNSSVGQLFYKTYLGENKPKEVRNASDTFINLSLISESSSIATVPEVLHYYRIHNKSGYNTFFDKDRFKEGEILYEKGIEVLNHFNIHSDNAKFFLYRVFAGHIRDLFNMAGNAKTVSFNERLDFICAAFEVPLFFLLLHVMDQLKELFIKTIELILESATDDLYKYMARIYYPVRYYDILKNNSGSIADTILKLSVFFDNKNKLGWAANIIPSGISTVNKAVEKWGFDDKNINLLINVMLDAYDKENYGYIEEILSILNSKIPLNSFVLYFNIQYGLATDNAKVVIDSAIYAGIFHPDNADLMQLSDRVFDIYREKTYA